MYLWNVLAVLEHPDHRQVEGLLRYLDGLVDGLDAWIEQPYATARKKAQRAIRAAQKWLRRNDFKRAAEMIRRAQEHLEPPFLH